MALNAGLFQGSFRLENVLAGGAPMRPGLPPEQPDATRRIQKALSQLVGAMPRSFPNGAAGEPDGVYGGETKTYVEIFQRRVFPRDWTQWDGIIGKLTLKEMDSALPKAASPVPPPPPPPVPPEVRVLGFALAQVPAAIARQTSAIKMLDWAKIAVDFPDTNDFNRAALDLVNRCFKIYENTDKAEWAKDIATIRSVYANGQNMFTTVQTNPDYFKVVATTPDSVNPKPANAFCVPGGWVSRDPAKFAITFVANMCDGKSKAWLLDAMTHESAHFCGPSGVNHVSDQGGTYDTAALRLPRAKAIKCAANHAWFAGLSQTVKENWPSGTYPS